MEFSLPIFLFVLVLGIIQLAVGVVFGRCLPLRGAPESSECLAELGHFRHLARRVYQLLAGLSRDVDHHQHDVARVGEELAAARAGDPVRLADFVVESISQLMHLNAQLQTRLSAAEEKLRAQTQQIESHVVEARTDPLTRLPNRRAFEDELVCRVAQWQRQRRRFHLVMIDLDHFKQLNDRYGHLAGDHVLRRVAAVLHSAVGEGEMVARVGGEEFAALLHDRPLPEARKLVEALRHAVAGEKFVFENTRLSPTISLGLATVQSGDDPVAVVARADEALYAAKRGGRNRSFYHNGSHCEPIGVPDASDAQWQQVCDQLRQRLSELIDAS